MTPSSGPRPGAGALLQRKETNTNAFFVGKDSSRSDTELLTAKKKARSRGKAEQDIIRRAMKEDRVCAMLSDEDVESVLETMEYFEFEANDRVVTQGEVGNTFFVVNEGKLRVEISGKVVNTLVSGKAFGGLALLYKCPRTASVTAVERSGCWGADGGVFKQVLQDNAQRQYAENREMMERMSLFDGLSGNQKDVVCASFSMESVDAGQRVVTEGEANNTLYFLKRGELSVCNGGKVLPSGKLEGAREVDKVRQGEWFGEISGEPHPHTMVVMGGRAHLLVISSKDLQEVLGDNFGSYLEKAFLLSGLRKSPEISEFSAAQQKVFSEAMAMRKYEAGATIDQRFRFAIVMEGDVRCPGADPMARGQWYEDKGAAGTQRAAGPSGCRLGVLSEEEFAKTLKRLGLEAGSEEAGDATRKMTVIRKVPAFRHLNEEQVAKLVNAFKLATFKKRDKVFQQGETGSEFYVIASGEVSILIGGKLIRNMGSNAYFGERALLFEEPRTATVEVISAEAQIWSVDKAVFSQIVKGKMQQVLMERIKLQDTSVTLKELKHTKVIGIGSAGTVRLVQHKQTQMRYALKRVRKKQNKVPSEVARECKLLAENDHPMVMHLVKTFETSKSVYMLTELITGGELHAAIRKIPTVLSRVQSQFYTGSLVLVLEALADRFIVYRDLKPENVMLDAQGYLKLVDFGISKKLQPSKPQTFTVIGTPHYMAPEILTGRGYSLEVDIWSLGVMLFEFVCGYLPFADELDDPTEVCQAVLRSPLKFPSRYKDQEGRACIEGMLRRHPKKRLGGGISGYEALKAAPYFLAGHGDAADRGSALFNKIMGRELEPPLVPASEQYSEDVDGATLSDAGELG
jgi:cGMP-dependent protein kinase